MKRSVLFLFFFLTTLFANYGEYEFRGQHFVASYLDCDQEQLNNISLLKNAFFDAIEKSGATILSSIEHIFEPNGYTMVVLLSESHASIHTYPEHKSCFVDLFTCGNNCHAQPFDQALKTYLKTDVVSQKIFYRDNSIYPSKNY